MTLNAALCLVGLYVVTFLLGSIPWGVVISRVFFKKDIRDEGSGNIGTTNAMRSMGKIGGGAVFVLDFGKGVLSGLIASQVSLFAFTMTTWASLPAEAGLEVIENALMLNGWCMAISFCGCVTGHIFSPWLGFKGGKGIAVAIGCLFVVFGWWGAWGELAIFIVLVLVTRYVSVGSIASAFACPFFAFYFYGDNIPAALLIGATGWLVVWAHRENIKRLLAGNENRIGKKKKEA